MQNSYITFMIIAILTFSITAFLEAKLIPILKKKAAQPIYLEGPGWHQSKHGTPTMGGLAFLIAIMASLALGAMILFIYGKDNSSLSLLLCALYALSNALIGLIDDLSKIRHKQNKGLSPMEKLLMQSLAAVLFLVARSFLLSGTEILKFGFGEVDLGAFYYPIAFIMLLATVNSANLTDGIDGLASSVAFAISIALMYISKDQGEEAFLISSAIIGATTAFLIFNLHPARIFMGDTGSLLLGALISASAITLGNPLIIIFLGGVYLIEALSVIIQVVFFKLTGKRVFKMAPIHHHLEQCGLTENTICIIAILATLILSIPAVMLYLS